MTKEELAKKKGIKIAKETQSPSEALVTTKPDEKKKEPKKTSRPKTSTPKKPVVTDKKTPEKVVTPSSNDVPVAVEKRSVGKPKKRKDGDKKLSLWIDEELVSRMYNNLSYGDSAGEFMNKALREYLDNHNLH